MNLYASNEATVELKDHHLKVKQETMYPWDGKVKLTIDPDQAGEFTMKLRIPGWARNQVLPGNLYHFSSQMEDRNMISVNDEQVNAKQENGYFTSPSH